MAGGEVAPQARDAREEEEEQPIVYPPEEKMRNYVAENADASLTFLFAENDLPLETQWAVADAGYRSTKMVGKMAADEKSIKELVHSDFDVPKNKAGRLIATKFAVIWGAARTQGETEDKMKAEAKVLNLPRPFDAGGHEIMKAAYEAKWEEPGDVLEESKVPTIGCIQFKIDEIERGIHKATQLYDVVSGDFEDGGPPAQSEDRNGVIRYLKTRNRASMPRDFEELRHRLEVEGIIWLFLAVRFYNRTLLRNLSPNTFLKHTNYLLGD